MLRTYLLAGLSALMLGAQELPPSDLNRIHVGEPAPAFTLNDGEGHSVSLADFRGKNVVLVFYRGYW